MFELTHFFADFLCWVGSNDLRYFKQTLYDPQRGNPERKLILKFYWIRLNKDLSLTNEVSSLKGPTATPNAANLTDFEVLEH